MLLRTEVDHVTGQLSDTRTRFLGTRPPKLLATAVNGRRSMLALSSRAWLGYSDQGRYSLAPLSFEALDHASSAFPSFLFSPDHRIRTQDLEHPRMPWFGPNRPSGRVMCHALRTSLIVHCE